MPRRLSDRVPLGNGASDDPDLMAKLVLPRERGDQGVGNESLDVEGVAAKPLRVAVVDVNVMVEPPPLMKLVPLAVRLPLTELGEESNVTWSPLA